MDDDASALSLAAGSYTFVVTSYDESAVGSYEFAFGHMIID